MKLGKKIASGAQAEIFKAQYGLDEVVVKRFLDSRHRTTKKEVEIIQQLRHKHIVQFYHVQQDMIVMEYVEGGSLENIIMKDGLKTWEASSTATSRVPTFYSPSTRRPGSAIFGHAIEIGEIGQGGTLQWMAPELLQDTPQYSAKSDVYALGMVMWEMASGSTRPYREHTPDGMIWCIMNGILEEYPDNTPKDYADCIQMCWKQVPEERLAAVDVLPDVGLSPQEEDGQELRSAKDNAEKPYYINALKEILETPKAGSSMEMSEMEEMLPQELKDMFSLSDKKMLDWFNTPSGDYAYAAAMLAMGIMHYHVKNYGEALNWYLAASEAGIAVAMLKISEMYQHGIGVEQDDYEEASWYQKAVEAVEAQDRINNRFVHHDAGVSEHHRGTMEWFSDGKNDEAAAVKLGIGNSYFNGELRRDYNKALGWYHKASDSGSTEAMRSIGIMYRNGLGVDQDNGKAMEWWLKASDAGDASAMRNIGSMYYNGFGVDQDYGMAMECYLKASDASDFSAMRNIGAMYENGQGIHQDYGTAMEWYLKAYSAGSALVTYDIGVMYYQGHGVGRDYGGALEWFYKASDAGIAEGMHGIGTIYSNGLGVEQDYYKGMEWYLQASDAGHAETMHNVGWLYHKGLGVDQDYCKAMEWFLKAGNAGHAASMRNIGVMYANGHGVEQDYQKAMEWYFKASDAGLAETMHSIGYMYYTGLGTDQDYGKAMDWFLKSSNAGYAYALYDIGLMYYKCHGVELDFGEAASWFLKASNAGVVAAMCTIGRMYEDGLGVEQDLCQSSQRWGRGGYTPDR
ncbi:hypothetical protein BGZ68_007500 [Mortierella alpina]|nr:hypothetical protein BGZ68_007500 [Mortierella alpina]